MGRLGPGGSVTTALVIVSATRPEMQHCSSSATLARFHSSTCFRHRSEIDTDGLAPLNRPRLKAETDVWRDVAHHVDMGIHRRQNHYDHRLRRLVYETQEVGIALGLGVPSSTAAGWLRHEPPDVVTLDICEMDAARLRTELARLRNRIRILHAVVGPLVSRARAFGGGLA